MTTDIVSPNRLHRLAPSDIESMRNAIQNNKNSAFKLLAAFVGYLISISNPRAVEFDDVTRISLQLNAAGLWDEVRPGFLVRCLVDSIEPSVLTAFCQAVDIDYNKTIKDGILRSSDNLDQMQDLLTSLGLSKTNAEAFRRATPSKIRASKPDPAPGISGFSGQIKKGQVKTNIRQHLKSKDYTFSATLRSYNPRSGKAIVHDPISDGFVTIMVGKIHNRSLKIGNKVVIKKTGGIFRIQASIAPQKSQMKKPPTRSKKTIKIRVPSNKS